MEFIVPFLAPPHKGEAVLVGVTLKWIYLRVGEKVLAFDSRTGMRRGEKDKPNGWRVTESTMVKVQAWVKAKGQ